MSDEWSVGGDTPPLAPLPGGGLLDIFNGGMVEARGFIIEGKPRRAIMALGELVERLAAAIEAVDGLLAPENADIPSRQAAQTAPAATEFVPTGATQSCMRNAHEWMPVDSFGRATCRACGTVTVTPK